MIGLKSKMVANGPTCESSQGRQLDQGDCRVQLHGGAGAQKHAENVRHVEKVFPSRPQHEHGCPPRWWGFALFWPE